jgi:methylthioribose-1-phosphate isomerase
LIKTVEWTDDGVCMIDQRKLPNVEEYPLFRTYQEVAEAIRVMVVRGAPAIGVAAAMGVALGVRDSKAPTMDDLRREFNEIVAFIGATRPTAVNLFWALDRMKKVFEQAGRGGPVSFTDLTSIDR